MGILQGVLTQYRLAKIQVQTQTQMQAQRPD
jgi:hypothetical protein